MSLTAVTFSAPDITLAYGDTLSYRGKLSADGQTIAGTWAEGDDRPGVLGLWPE
jgi:hypothetical protein